MEPHEQTTEEIWEDFWEPMLSRIEAEQGISGLVQISENKLNQIKLELADYRVMMHEVNLAYCDVTGGYISKPNTAARHVIDRVEERIQEQRDEAQREIVDYLLEKDQEGHFASFTAGDLADLIMVHFGITGNPNFDDKRVDGEG